MPETEEKKKEKRFSFKKLNRKYVFMMSHDDTMEPIVDFRVNLLKMSIITIVIIVLLMTITAVVIAFTPLREYIPGYTEKTFMEREVYELNRRADSIEQELMRKDIYFNNLKLVIEGYDFQNDSVDNRDIYSSFLGFNADTIEIKKSVQDSALRAEFEAANFYNLNAQSNLVKNNRHTGVASFFTPITGTVIKPFDRKGGHYGIDIEAPGNQGVKAVLDGTVIYSSWTFDFGYTIGIQHENNYFSTYKHNAALLKKEGDFVKAGETIAVSGESGEVSSGPQLHFELWHNGTPLNPQEYINFEKQ